MPDSSYKYLTIILTRFLQKLPGTDIEINTQVNREALESFSHYDSEHVLCLDKKNWHTYVKVKDAIDTALRELHWSYPSLEIQRAALKTFF